ncbi:hypothetical protein EC844_11486 [Acinetobacter calcoaceticus]|uniref:Uncharacterized protein n=1 Tax=Acinetobacter calcoaceticus TaxID=471 RepID=A0A4R1XTV4_ACICA|nr:hypothetical protein EC844_11486 [Acinetobacter calcoaceticus]
MKKSNDSSIQFNIFPIFILGGPAIAAMLSYLSFVILITLQYPDSLFRENNELLGIFIMVVIYSYILGIAPAIVTALSFNGFMKKHNINLKLKHFIRSGFYSNLIWFPLVLLFNLIGSDLSKPLNLIFMMMFPVTFICVTLSWLCYHHRKKKIKSCFFYYSTSSTSTLGFKLHGC